MADACRIVLAPSQDRGWADTPASGRSRKRRSSWRRSTTPNGVLLAMAMFAPVVTSRVPDVSRFIKRPGIEAEQVNRVSIAPVLKGIPRRPSCARRRPGRQDPLRLKRDIVLERTVGGSFRAHEARVTTAAPG